MCNAWFPRAMSNCVLCDGVCPNFLQTVYNKAILLNSVLSDIGNKLLEFLLKLGIYIFD